ncbi:hypothetical protein KF4_047 [Vibrio phage vB_VpaS_KF4]|nr:hypothetical protein KF4_047 [Vibrio phage vB_VpaS_KF4]
MSVAMYSKGRDDPNVVEMCPKGQKTKGGGNVPNDTSKHIAAVLVLLVAGAITWAGFQLNNQNAALHAQAAVSQSQNDLLKQLGSDVRIIQSGLAQQNGDMRVLRVDLNNTMSRVTRVEDRQQLLDKQVLQALLNGRQTQE